MSDRREKTVRRGGARYQAKDLRTEDLERRLRLVLGAHAEHPDLRLKGEVEADAALTSAERRMLMAVRTIQDCRRIFGEDVR